MFCRIQYISHRSTKLFQIILSKIQIRYRGFAILIRCQGCDQAVFLMDCSGSSIRMNNIFPCIKTIYRTFQCCITLGFIACLSILFCNVELCIYTFVCYIFSRCLSDSKSHIIRLCINLISCWNRDFFQINNFLCLFHCEL